MMEFAFLCARWGHHISALVAFGSFGFVLLADHAGRPSLSTWHKNALRQALILSVVALAAGVLVLLAQLSSLPDSSLTAVELLDRLLGQSRFGLIWKIREASLLGTVIFAAAASRLAERSRSLPFVWLAWGCAGASLIAAPFSGHSAAAEPAWPALSAHVLHLLSAGSWLGALPILMSLAVFADTNPDARPDALTALQRFSAAALPSMFVIVVTGSWIAFVHIEKFPALLGTTYGYILMAKISALIVVLILAARLRWKLLPRLDADASATRDFARWVRIEWLIALAIAALAVWLAQTIPARHDAINWLLPFRISIAATWDSDWIAVIALSSLAATLLGAVAVFMAISRRAAMYGPGAAGAILLAAGSITGVWAISVEAYPGTYRQPSIPYQTISVAAGAELFRKHCAKCHGASGHGDGAAAVALPVPPADLTEPHTAFHTAGDIFWWLTYGKPPGAMPGFDHVLSEDDRWDLINYLRILSAGYQARIITEEIVPLRPWMGAVDFNYTDQFGRFETLKDHRERNAVLLVLFSPAQSIGRLEKLASFNKQIEAAGALILAVPIDEPLVNETPATTPLWPFRVVDEGASDAVVTYSLMRRTLFDADARDEGPVPAHMELLIDRYGYVRARWLPAQNDAWVDPATLLRQINALVSEPKILEPPDDHVH